MSTEREKIATLIHHWIEHNEGHRESYLEWRDKLADEDLPATVAALEEVAELSARANEALKRAVGELSALGGCSHLPGSHDHAGHDHAHGGSAHSH